MRRILIYILAWTSILAMSGCLDDKNDYNYSEINKLDGKITGMKSEYLIAYAEKLTLTPTFKFTIDKENPDVSYEWRIDGNLLPEETAASCTFSFESIGVYEVTFTVVDNKSGVKFSQSSTLKVRSPFIRGWVILGEDESENSVLSFVGARSITYKMEVSKPNDPEKKGIIDRDSLVYDQVMRNVTPGLGTQPKGLFLNAGFAGQGWPIELYEISDEVGVMQKDWAELNGNTLQVSVHTEEEFRGQLPEAGFHPQAIAMTYSSKAMLNSDGCIYWATNSFASDFHACAYVNYPLGGGKQFSGVYPSYRVNKFHNIIPASTKENEIVGIADEAVPKSDTNPEMKVSFCSSKICSVMTGQYSGEEDDIYKLGEWKVVDMMPATPHEYNERWYRQDIRPGYLALLKNGSAYSLFYFLWNSNASLYKFTIWTLESNRFSINGLSGYTDMAVFNNKQYVVIAEGNNLWYCQYGKGKDNNLKLLHTFSSPVKALAANDIYIDTFDIANPASSWQPEHNGQLGVALEDGTFAIYEVLEAEGTREEAEINQLFPDLTAPVDNRFGKIVDIIYKYGSVAEFNTFQY